jgi:IMP dehydrogenase/GMP reductase
MKFDLNDVLIEPKYISYISSRKEIDYKHNGRLPIFVSPMDTVINNKNYKQFYNKGMNICLPRGITVPVRDEEIFHSYGLDEILGLIEFVKDKKDISPEVESLIPSKILIDIANGHMLKLYETISFIKKRYPDKTLMVGNVANPNTYKLLSDAGADYIRVGIGNGGGCLTSQQTGVGFPMGSLIQECYKIKIETETKAKIVADGGFKTYSDIIKALALGADYVMLGSMLSKTIESCGDSYIDAFWFKVNVNQKIAEYLFNKGYSIKKKFRGMSTKEVQRKWGKENIKTSEGVVRYYNVGYTLDKWTDNFIDYLRSAMSYTDSTDLNKFIGNVNINIISSESYKRFNK